jgi:hypothetical protein
LRLAVVLLGCTAAISAQALETSPPRPRSEGAADSLGRQLVEIAVEGHLEEAFALADALRRAGDSELATILAAEKQQLLVDQPRLGAFHGLKRTDTAHFGETFVRWYYEASFESGTQRWMLTFRNRPDGWFLNGIVVGCLPEPAH